jgi:HD domain-containing protein
MPVKDDSRLRPPGGDTAALLSRRLRDAVKVAANGSGNGNGRHADAGSRDPSRMSRDLARRVAGDIGAAMLAEANADTAEHSDDVVLITEAIGERMKVSGEAAGDLLAAARLHDIGKVWIPPELLDKPGPLNADEWDLMRQHTLVGERILSAVDELDHVARLVRHSHERWDGRGYPDGLAGSEIPLGSRIIFCADAFHAIRCDRPYRPGRSAREAVAEITRCAGTQFDPRVASALEQVVRERSRRPSGRGGSTRLLALLMCLVLGGAGSAIARSGALSEPAAGATTPSSPPACGPAGCPTVAGPTTQEAGAISAPVLPPGLRVAALATAAKAANGQAKAPAGASAPGKGKHKGKGKGKHKAKGHHKGKGHHGHGGASAASSHGQSAHSDPASPSYVSPSSSGSSGGSHGSSHSGSSHGHSGSHGRRGSRGGSTSHGNGNANGHYK